MQVVYFPLGALAPRGVLFILPFYVWDIEHADANGADGDRAKKNLVKRHAKILTQNLFNRS